MVFIQWRTWNWGVQHELVKISIMVDGIRYDPVDVLGRVVFQTDYGGSQNPNAMGLKKTDQMPGVDAFKFAVIAAVAFQAHPNQ